VAKLPDFFTLAGLECCHFSQYTVPKHHLKAFADMQFMVNGEMSYRGMNQEQGMKYRELIGESWKEGLNGVVIQHYPTVTIGRKPV
jgi:hypothetical protein